MSNWEEAFNSHAIHENLRTLKENLDALPQQQGNLPFLNSRNRINQILDYLNLRLRNTNPALVQKQHLDTISKHLQGITSEINAYKSDNNLDRIIINSINSAEATLPPSVHIPIVSTEETTESFSKIVSETYENAKQFISEILTSKEGFEKEIHELKKLIENQGKTIQDQANTIDKQKERLDSNISEFQKQFSTAESKRSERFSSTIEDLKKNHETLIQKTQEEIEKGKVDTSKKFEALEKELKDSSSNTIKYLDTKMEEAKKLVGIIGNIGVTGNFNTIANQERTVANWLRGIAIFLMVATASLYGWSFWDHLKNEISWTTTLFRILGVIIFLAPAFYCAQESRKHRKNEILNRKFELELASIDPFLEKLPEDKRNELKAELTQKMFGQRDSEQPQDTISSNKLFDLFEKFILNFTKN